MLDQTTQPDTLYTTIEVPELDGVMIHTLICPIAPDGSISLPGYNYTPEQEQAIIAYLTWNHDHLDLPRGARLRMMPEPQQALLDRAIQTLKSPAQLLKERIVASVLAEHIPGGKHRVCWCSWYERIEHLPWLEELVQLELLPCVETPLYEVSISEGYERRFPCLATTVYRVAVLPDDTSLPDGDLSHTTRFYQNSILRIIASWQEGRPDDEEDD